MGWEMLRRKKGSRAKGRGRAAALRIPAAPVQPGEGGHGTSTGHEHGGDGRR